MGTGVDAAERLKRDVGALLEAGRTVAREYGAAGGSFRRLVLSDISLARVALIRGLVAGRGFLSILPRELVSKELKSGSMRMLKIGATPDTRPAGMMYLAACPPGNAAARVASVLRETCAEPHRRRSK